MSPQVLRTRLGCPGRDCLTCFSYPMWPADHVGHVGRVGHAGEDDGEEIR